MIPNFNRLIDHTLLRPDATAAEIRKLCEEARAYDFASVCVQPLWVQLAAECLAGSGVKVCTVIGFPTGAHETAVKQRETELARAAGCEEFDMVLQLGALKEGEDAAVLADIAAVRRAAQGGLVKVIIETFYLNREEKCRAARLAVQAGADFVKTCTGFNAGVATVEDVRLLRSVLPAEVQVKASAGIRSYAQARALVEAGAARIGASAGVAIMKEAEAEGK